MFYSPKYDAYMFSSIEELDENADRSEINDYIFNKIKKAITEKLDDLVLFYIKIDDVIYTTSLKKENLLPPLKKCLAKYENEENYEKCSECLNFIKILEI